MRTYNSGVAVADVTELISEVDVQRRVMELAEELRADYEGDSLLTLGVLNGSVLFLADLVRYMNMPLEYDFVGLSSYSGTVSVGPVEITRRMKADVSGKRVLVVEDIIDTGRTLVESKLIPTLLNTGAVDVKVCTLLDKPARRTHSVHIDYTGYTIENLFVVGYGMDYNGLYRNLPYIGFIEG